MYVVFSKYYGDLTSCSSQDLLYVWDSNDLCVDIMNVHELWGYLACMDLSLLSNIDLRRPTPREPLRYMLNLVVSVEFDFDTLGWSYRHMTKRLMFDNRVVLLISKSRTDSSELHFRHGDESWYVGSCLTKLPLKISLKYVEFVDNLFLLHYMYLGHTLAELVIVCDSKCRPMGVCTEEPAFVTAVCNKHLEGFVAKKKLLEPGKKGWWSNLKLER